tara:strand:- start:403 stop:585 length:183 start_codon:yes stop_codon:yes gene_type:complete
MPSAKTMRLTLGRPLRRPESAKDAANELMDDMGWVVSSPKTAAEWSLIHEAMEKARRGKI